MLSPTFLILRCYADAKAIPLNQLLNLLSDVRLSEIL